MKFEEWANKGINVEIRYKYFYNPDKIMWVANISRRGYNGKVIKEEDCEKLEFQAARWLNDFRRVLKEL